MRSLACFRTDPKAVYMKIYFLRHGETNFNKEMRFQLPETPLNDHGIKQAKSLAKRFSHISTDLILSSPYQRAFQTAQEIKKITGIKVVKNDLFRERLMPTSFRGKLVEDPEVIPQRNKIRAHFGQEKYHFEDEKIFMIYVKEVYEHYHF